MRPMCEGPPTPNTVKQTSLIVQPGGQQEVGHQPTSQTNKHETDQFSQVGLLCGLEEEGDIHSLPEVDWGPNGGKGEV